MAKEPSASFYAIRDIFEDARKYYSPCMPSAINCLATVTYKTDKQSFNFTHANEQVYVSASEGMSEGKIFLADIDADRYHSEFEAKYQTITYSDGVITITGLTSSKAFSNYEVTISDIKWNGKEDPDS